MCLWADDFPLTLTLTKTIDEPMVISPYSLTKQLYLSSSESQSIYNCLIPSTVSSSCFRVSSLAFGAKR